MATLTIGGRKVTVDDKFLSLPPEEQQKTVDEIASSLNITPETAAPAGPPLDPGFQPGGTGTPAPLLARKAMQEPQWPQAQGQAVSPSPISDMGPMSEGLGVDQSPLTTAFPNPVGEFPTPLPPPGGWNDSGTSPMRAAKLTAQALGNAAINVPGIVADVPALAAKGIESGIYGLGKTFGLFNRPDHEEVSPTPLPTDALKGGLSSIFSNLGYEAADPSTSGEKALSNIVQYGAEGLGGGLALSRGAAARAAALKQPGALPMALDKYVMPYAAQPAKTIGGDVAAGGTAGLGLTGSQEFLPEEVRKAGGGTVGAAADLAALLAGGVTGGTAAAAATGLPNAILQGAAGRRAATDVPVDPITGKARQSRDVDEASRVLRGLVTDDPNKVAAEIGASRNVFEGQGLPNPTTELMTTDPGLMGMGTRIRTQVGAGPAFPDPNASAATRDQYSFGARDTAMRQAAADQVQGIRPQGVNPEDFVQSVEARAAAELAAKQSEVERTAGRVAGVQRAREQPAEQLLESEGRTPAASRDIHGVYEQSRTLDQRQRDTLYNNPAWVNAKVDASPVLKAARNINLDSTFLNPVKDQLKPVIDRVFEQFQSGRILKGGELTKFSNDIEDIIANSGLKRGDLFTELKKLKDSVDDSINALPDNHPGKLAIGEARAYSATVTKPQFRQYAGGQLDRDIKTSPGQVYPSETGPKVLATGEDTAQIMNIARTSGQEPFVAGQARTVMFDDAIKAGAVSKEGVIDPEKLTRWRNRNQDRIGQVPGLGDEVNTMIQQARSGEQVAARRAGQQTKAEESLKTSEQRLTTGPIGDVRSQPIEKSIPAVMANKDPVKAMTEVRKQLGGDAKAETSLKAAVTDHFLNKIKALDPLNEGDYGVRLDALMKEYNGHRKTLVAAGFTPDDMQALQRAQTLLMPLRKRMQATTGSQTAERTSEAALRPLELALKSYYGILRGGGVFRTFKVALKTVVGDRTSDVTNIITQAMFDPKLAQALLTRDTKKAGGAAWNAELQKALRRVTVARDLAKPEEKDEDEQ